MSGITNGIIGRTITVADFSLTETYHDPLLRLRPHDHEHANINIVIEGYLDETVERTGFPCRAFSSLLKPGGAKHANMYGTKQTHCLIVEFMPQFAEYLGHRQAVSEIRHATSIGSRSVAKQLWSEFNRTDSATSLILEGMIIQLLGNHHRSQRSSGMIPRWLLRCREILESDLDHPRSISELSRQVGIDRTHLTERFTWHFGIPPGTYVRRRRIERAQDLLRTTEKPLCEIAIELGFYDQSHFGRAFAAQTGSTPTEFRRACRTRTSQNPTFLQDSI